MWPIIFWNLRGRLAYTVIMATAVALAVTAALYATILTGDVRKELERNSRLLGPDIAVVPKGTKEGGQLYITKGPPGHALLGPDVRRDIAAFPEIVQCTGQQLLEKENVGGTPVALIAYDPATDFVVSPWIATRIAESIPEDGGHVLLGHRVAPDTPLRGTVRMLGREMTVAGRLGEASSFIDTSAFMPRADAEDADVSWYLLRLKPGASIDIAVNRLSMNIPSIEVIMRPEVLRTLSEQLDGLTQGQGLGVTTVLIVIAAMLVVGAIFALVVHERRRELGLLKAMGARNLLVFRLILLEAMVVILIGIVVGCILSLLWLALTEGGTAGKSLLSSATLTFILGRIALTTGLTLAVGILTVLWPALVATRMEPYAAIRSGE
ncbi:MAG: FtsX-like permease family protein [Desulfovibrio sp.]|jgi:putative ABC transport system permease protein|nr:FtsX-like permease family protein [Desulfovibrio sp.]